MAASFVREDDDQDDLVMDFECERVEDSEADSASGGESDSDTDTSDSSQSSSDTDDSEASGDGADAEGERRRLVEWDYEPLPRGEPGQNVGDAGPAHVNRLHENVDNW